MAANVLIMAGGTGGHVFPALACAREFQARGYRVHWLGTPRGIENELVPAAGLPLHLINVSGLRGKGKLSLLKAPLQLIKALFSYRLGFEPSDPMAKALHYVTGVIGYPLGYFLLTRNGVSLGRRYDGWLWGTFTTFIALGIFAPLAGLPFMLLAWGGQLTFMSTIGHALYGAMAAYVAQLMLDRPAR